MRTRCLLKSAFALAAFTVLSTGAGCGGGSSATQAELEQARSQGAAEARRASAIRELRKDVASLKRQSRASSASPVISEPPAAGESSPSEAGRVPASGTYFGHAEQRGEPAAVNKDFPINMSFSSSGSFVDYPTLDCEGSLRPIGFEGVDRVYEETITSGHCDSGGLWRVYVESESQLDATWSLPSARYRVAAVLLR